MNNYFLSLVFLLSFSFSFLGQECGTVSPTNYQTFERTKQERGFDRASIQLHPEICLNVYYHIVRNSNGTGNGITENTLAQMTNLLNIEFNPHNLFFNQLGFDYIDNSTYFNLQELEFDPLVQINNQADAINVYIVDTAPFNGQANGIGSQALVIPKLNVLKATLPHEVGHCLNLLHTHDTLIYGAENIPRTGPNANCSSAGDQLCDTPADPGLGNGNVNSNCNYTGGGGYIPDTYNIMSLSREICKNRFTIGQELRMRDAIYALSVLQAVVSNSCGIIEGDTITCLDPTTTLTITHASGPYFWEVSGSSLEIVGSATNSSVTVRAINNTIREWGFVEVNYANGGMEHYPVWVGKPVAPTSLSGPTLVNSGSWYTYHGGGGGATSYQWVLPYPFDPDYDIVNPVDQSSDNWQMLPTTSGYNSNIWTGNGGHNGLVQLIGVNKCGIGGSTHIYVEHDNTTSCTTCDFSPPNPVPNSADENFILDFSSYPEGTYYIYIYDQYSNILYEGESTNIEKTVGTIGIPNGLYYLHIHDGNEVITQQLIINH